ncbi:3',5'-cyclic AMP phosphodiesterase CpdA [Dyadobacter jejuensis]|uniref:3',5'-cyclic AMP phosphodiesterase CpdA n=1 Tax=Dyadobacter jejuensis TaxID=1082580 RepID=A0A316AMN1_9BACT|nr:metallophosphoesterase [Dyadobacter jejuensis]PWJ58993.1 3',5'-cyclic AMP phosphodiesterase CpdA [Dyadobacter jejuensis]
MSNNRVNVLLDLLVCIGIQIPCFSQSTIKSVDTDHFEIEISQNNPQGITILQVTDMHIGGTGEGKWKKDLITYKRIRKLIETYNPDLLAVTGDLLTGEKPFGALLASSVVQFFDGLERPWLYVFGNHDPEGGFGRQAIAEVFAESKWHILGKHPVNSEWNEKYDYLVDLKILGSDKPAWQVYGFDSGSEKGYKSIKSDQLDWYKQTSQASLQRYGQKTRAISIFHIPLIQYQLLQNDTSMKKQGHMKEKVWYEEDDGSVYETFLEVGNIEATFCGHDHYNNYWGTYKGGITLAYGYISGESTKYAWPPGGKLITLPTDGTAIQIENVVPVLD